MIASFQIDEYIFIIDNLETVVLNIFDTLNQPFPELFGKDFDFVCAKYKNKIDKIIKKEKI